jgi:hypothetical protein
MGSLIEELKRREAAARAEADRPPHTLGGARRYVRAVIEHASRRIRILGAASHPAACWVAREEPRHGSPGRRVPGAKPVIMKNLTRSPQVSYRRFLHRHKQRLACLDDAISIRPLVYNRNGNGYLILGGSDVEDDGGP